MQAKFTLQKKSYGHLSKINRKNLLRIAPRGSKQGVYWELTHTEKNAVKNGRWIMKNSTWLLCVVMLFRTTL